MLSCSNSMLRICSRFCLTVDGRGEESGVAILCSSETAGGAGVGVARLLSGCGDARNKG